MADYTIVNGTNAELTNVNVGGTDVAARTIKEDVTLTDAELATLVATTDVLVIKDDLSRNDLRRLARHLKYVKKV